MGEEEKKEEEESFGIFWPCPRGRATPNDAYAPLGRHQSPYPDMHTHRYRFHNVHPTGPLTNQSSPAAGALWAPSGTNLGKRLAASPIRIPIARRTLLGTPSRRGNNPFRILDKFSAPFLVRGRHFSTRCLGSSVVCRPHLQQKVTQYSAQKASTCKS